MLSCLSAAGRCVVFIPDIGDFLFFLGVGAILDALIRVRCTEDIGGIGAIMSVSRYFVWRRQGIFVYLIRELHLRNSELAASIWVVGVVPKGPHFCKLILAL